MSIELGFVSPVVLLRSQNRAIKQRRQSVTMTARPTRRTFLSLASSAVLLALPFPSTGSAALSREEAEQEARLAYASLPKLSEFIDLKDFEGFRLQLRTGAMSRVRTACSSWYRSFEPTDERAIAGEKLYRGLIKAVEEADSAALKAGRGGDSERVSKLVSNIGLRFDEFLAGVGG